MENLVELNETELNEINGGNPILWGILFAILDDREGFDAGFYQGLEEGREFWGTTESSFGTGGASGSW